ncbi:MAG: recombination mediator RecR [Rickettsiales bacterium]|jgi:recombination protein RecR|nr:recombination mediator RecR [Rickettsiales bacterium]
MSKDYIINNLISSLQRLPSVGYRTAKRIALSILQNKDEVIKPLLDSLNEAYLKIKKCSICGNLTTDNVCEICSDERRDKQIICIVENIIDLWAIENVNIHNGIYHILDGTLSAVEGRGIEVLRIEKLVERIKNHNIREVIIATNPTSDGQTTAFYIASHLEEFNLRISQPALGVPMGSELNYLDDSTLNIAFKNKKEF